MLHALFLVNKRLMKGAFREQLEQAVKFENQVFAERVTSDEAKESIQSVFREAQASMPSPVNTPIDCFCTSKGRMRLHA
jgi:hypothetical protein